MKLQRIHFVGLILTLRIASPALGCASFFGDGKPVKTKSEEALIIWNESTHTEHFIRTANFETGSKDVGFIVPTPSKPQLEEADPAIFSVLRNYGQETKGMAMISAPRGAVSAVNVLETRTVAGMDVAILEASDAGALANWLKEHSFVYRAELKSWLEPYVQAHWKITAFKYSSDPKQSDLITQAVRLTFKSDMPIYPYREPTDAPAVDGRELRVYVVAKHLMEAKLLSDKSRWSAKVVFQGPIKELLPQKQFSDAYYEQRRWKERLTKVLPKDENLGESLFLTTYVDGTPKRKPADLGFFRETK